MDLTEHFAFDIADLIHCLVDDYGIQDDTVAFMKRLIDECDIEAILAETLAFSELPETMQRLFLNTIDSKRFLDYMDAVVKTLAEWEQTAETVLEIHDDNGHPQFHEGGTPCIAFLQCDGGGFAKTDFGWFRVRCATDGSYGDVEKLNGTVVRVRNRCHYVPHPHVADEAFSTGV